MQTNRIHAICLSLQKDSSEQPELQYDEFGFRMDTEGIVFTHMYTHFFHINTISESQSRNINGNVNIWVPWQHYVHKLSVCDLRVLTEANLVSLLCFF